MSKHFKNKTPVQNSRPMHYRGPSTLAHLPPAGMDFTMPRMHPPMPPPAVIKHSIPNPKEAGAVPPIDLESPLTREKHLKDSEYLPEAEKILHVQHDHRPSL
ncbi:MAG: hypothetical protein WCG21_11630 [Eubacteriales bacterium]